MDEPPREEPTVDITLLFELPEVLPRCVEAPAEPVLALLSREAASAAGLRVVAPEVSVVLAVVDLDGTPEAAAPWPAAKSPPDLSDSAAKESEVISPVPS